MKSSEFPAFVRSLPEADLPFDGLRGWLLQSDSGQVLFNESDIEVSVPEHAHGDQWGVVINGKIELTIGDQTRMYSRGDTYFIPAGTPHRGGSTPVSAQSIILQTETAIAHAGTADNRGLAASLIGRKS